MEDIEKEGVKPIPAPTPDVKDKESKPQPVPPTDIKGKEPKPQKQPVGAFRRGFRWFLGLLIAVGLGALLVTLLYYIPLRQQLKESQAEVDQVKQQVVELEGNIERFSPLETENQDLQSELNQADLRIALLSARAEIVSAQLALAKEDPEAARLALKDAKDRLKDVERLLKPADKGQVTDLLSRLDLAVKGIGLNDYAAASDLDVLANGLLELENSYFPEP